VLATQRFELENHGPLIEVDEWRSLQLVRYNHRSIAPLDLAYDDIVPFYRAARVLPAMLRQSDFRTGSLFGRGVPGARQ